jgi:N-carbamoyl-L-amino-acid hydrolase
MDSVPRGGNFDGAAGVIAGLLCLMRMKRSGKVPPRTVRVVGLRGEESAWFGICYLGSRALFGALTAEDLASRHRDTSRPLSEYMRESGAAVDLIAAGHPVLDRKSVAAYYELHIEQGPVMVARNLPVGIVTGIRGNIRYQAAKCLGEAGHSGAVPRWLRHDAVLATADLLHRMDEHWRVLLERGTDLVITAGIFSTHPAEHAATRIPNEVTFSLDIRSQDKSTLDRVHQLLFQECAAVARERRVDFALGRVVVTEPARMDQALVRRLGSICDGLGVPTEEMPSGAGHDAAEFANHEIPSAMIFIRNEHGSHNPDEAMNIADFLLGTEVLYHAVSEND